MSEIAFHEKAGRSQVDSFVALLNKVFSPAEWPLSPCFHPHSRGAIRFARCMLGVLGSAGAAICLAPCGSALGEWNLGQAINAVTGTRLWAFVFSLPGTVLFLRGCRYCRSAAVVQRFVHFSAHPQVMQQHRQLSRGRHDGSLLSVSPATLGQLQAPAPEITVHTERSQNVLRSLHQQRPQIRIAFLADVHLRLALTGVSSSRLQSQIAAHVAALAETMRIFQRQQERQRDQRAHALDLLQQRHLRIALLRQFLDPLVVLGDALAQRLDCANNGSSAACSSGLKPSAFSGFMFRTLHPRNRSP